MIGGRVKSFCDFNSLHRIKPAVTKAEKIATVDDDGRLDLSSPAAKFVEPFPLAKVEDWFLLFFFPLLLFSDDDNVVISHDTLLLFFLPPVSLQLLGAIRKFFQVNIRRMIR
jgi:hypothetical protein